MSGKNIGLLRLLLAVGLALALLGLWELGQDGIGYGKLLGAYNFKYLLVMGVVAASAIACAAGLRLTWTPGLERTLQGLRAWRDRLGRWKVLNWVGLALLGLGVPLVVMVWPFSEVFVSIPQRLWLFWMLTLAGILLVKSAWREGSLFQAALASLLAQGLVVELATNLPSLSASMFTLAWSEGSRYYEASLFFAKSIYGAALPLPVLHPTRYFLQSLAFLVPGAGIAFDRLWQVILWLGCNGLAAWALARRLKISNRAWFWLTLAWIFLYFYQGPVYYHLILCAVPVLLWFDRRRLGRSLVIVLLASIWAGLSRVNWYPVPGLLAAFLYFLEEPQGKKTILRYLVPPALGSAAGLATAYLANLVYISLSGDPPFLFGSALSSPLLWYRLFPNSTYGPGILLAALIISLPGFLLLAFQVLPGLRRWKPIRLLGLAAILGVFLAGGIVVSAKIGGGDLHNLDIYLVLMAVILVYMIFCRFAPDREAEPARRPSPALLAALVLLAAALPVELQVEALTQVPVSKADSAYAAATVAELQREIDSQAGKGPVLFLSDRQLVTFHDLQVPNFEPKYEKVFLMEMVMSNNQAYLEAFHQDVEQHKFSMIVTARMNANFQGMDHAFSEENNQWVEQVELPVLASYRLYRPFDNLDLDVYIPR